MLRQGVIQYSQREEITQAQLNKLRELGRTVKKRKRNYALTVGIDW